jgi:NAD(P)-dependent dehydrogenase (short-subunit alcohol dehydrogenase family)
MMRAAVVTGVSTGIGYACAIELARQGVHVFGSVRHMGDGDRLRAEINDRFTPLVFDVTDAGAVRAAAEQVAAAVGDYGLWGLVNNAGIAVSGPLQHLQIDELRHQFEVNLFGLLGVTQAFLPLLGARRACPHPPGRIVNISSVSGRIAFPFLGPYSASKHALEALSDSLRRELLIYGVDVIVIQPGAIRTPIWDKAAQEDAGWLAGTDYYKAAIRFQRSAVAQGREGGLPSEQVAQTVFKALNHAKPKTRYLLAKNKLTHWWLVRALPDRWFDKLITRMLKLQKV